MTTGLVLAAVVSSGFGLIGLWLKLRFLRHVYDRGGAADLRAASEALPENRWRCALPGGRRHLTRRRRKNNPPAELPSLPTS